MDAITLLKNDHKSVEQLFKRFEKAGDRAFVEKRKIVDRIIEELSVHAAIEEQLFYPVVRATVPGTEDTTLESLEEHHVVKWLLSELEDLDPQHERFDAKAAVLIESVRHHVEEEENELFPKVRDELGRSALADLGEAMAEAKQTAPTRPHPRLPDSGPGAAVVGTVAGVVDRVTDNISGVAQGGVTAVQDLIARIRGTKKPKVSPSGSKVARKRADAVRRAAATATDGVKETAGTATSGAKATARAASAGAKGTATSAKRSAGDTKSTAKRAATTTGRTAAASAKKSSTTAKRAARKTQAAASGSKKDR
jgi:hemerythrin-like domain-containing protein